MTTRMTRALPLALAVVLGASLVVAPSAAFAATPTAPAVVAPAPPSVVMPAGTLQTMDGQIVLWSRNANSQRRVASTIKMLNALVVREHADLDEMVVVPKQAEAIWDGDVGLRAGQRLRVRQLLQMMLVASANDAAEAVAIHIAGSEAAYVRMMNAKAEELGLSHTRAADPHGLSKREYSTAQDLTVIAREFMKDPVLRTIVRQRFVMVPRPGATAVRHESTDQLLGSCEGVLGIKTGYTNPAGYCFVAAAKRGDVELVGVVLGTASNKARFTQMHRLLDWGFAHYRTRTVVSKDATAGVAAIVGGTEATVTVHPERSFSALDFDGQPFTAVFEVATSTPAPISAGQRLGQVLVVRQGQTVDTVPLVADKSVAVRPLPAPASSASFIVLISNAFERLFVLWHRITGT